MNDTPIGKGNPPRQQPNLKRRGCKTWRKRRHSGPPTNNRGRSASYSMKYFIEYCQAENLTVLWLGTLPVAFRKGKFTLTEMMAYEK